MLPQFPTRGAHVAIPSGRSAHPKPRMSPCSIGIPVNKAGGSGEADPPSPPVAYRGQGRVEAFLGVLSLGARGSFGKMKVGALNGVCYETHMGGPVVYLEFSLLGPIPECPATHIFGRKHSAQKFITGGPNLVPVLTGYLTAELGVMCVRGLSTRLERPLFFSPCPSPRPRREDQEESFFLPCSFL